MPERLFQSFFMGGFECSSHRNSNGRRLDLIKSTQHDKFAEADYSRMMDIGLETARDGIRWHLVEPEPYRYDFSSLESQIAAVKSTGIQVIWDYFHYGYPDDLDIFGGDFVERFSLFSTAVTKYLQENLGGELFVCPVNEISFFAWIAGERGVFHPSVRRRGNELKAILIEASLKSVDAIYSICPTARIIFTDPAIHVVPKDETAASKRAAEIYRRAQFKAFDKLASANEYDSANSLAYLDIIGLNYYFHNQWRHPGRRLIANGHEKYRPFHQILIEFHNRFQRPIVIAETGIEDDARASWFKYVCDEAAIAISEGVEIQGICLYPIVNHPGWADMRHCHNGLWDYPNKIGEREIYQPLADEIVNQKLNFR